MASITLGTSLRQIHRLFRDGTSSTLSDAQLLERFLAQGDPGAFESLVARHGPMVLAVCRALLKDPHDVEDAFQATFLALVKKGDAIRGHDALAGWLHRVAHHVAVQANRDTAMRRGHEKAAVLPATGVVVAEDVDMSRSLHAALHEEVARLPEKCRLAIVHCYLEGKTHAQAAAELRWGEATVRRRLADARELLRSRLTSRGLIPTLAALTATSIHEASAAIPEPWLRSTVKAGVAMATNRGNATGVAAALAEAGLRGMGAARFTLAVMTTLALGVAATMGTGLVAALAGDNLPPATAQPAPEPPKGTPKEVPASELGASPSTGRVLDPRGKPVAGATLFSTSLWSTKGEQAPLTSTSNADGRFQLLPPEYPKEEYAGSGRPPLVIVARAPGYGLGIEEVGPSEHPHDLRLVEDEPITVRVLDLEGRPVVGATIRPERLWCPKDGDLTARLRAFADSELPRHPEPPGLTRRLAGVIPPAVTGADGRVRIEGLGRERLLTAIVEGPTIETSEITIMTRRANTVRRWGLPLENVFFGPVPILTTLQASEPSSETRVTSTLTGKITVTGSEEHLHVSSDGIILNPDMRPTGPLSHAREILGATSDVVLAPSLPISGTVRDRSTGTPLAGVEVRTRRLSSAPVVKATTDRDGNYSLTGLPIDFEVQLSAAVPDDQPYLPEVRSIKLRTGERPRDVSFNLQRGVWISGRAIDRSTGQPVKGQAAYFAFADNPHARSEDFPEIQDVESKGEGSTSHDGSFRIIGLPGRGIVAFQASQWIYSRGLGAGTIRGLRRDESFTTYPICYIRSFHNLVEINPPEGTERQTQDLVVDPGRTVKIKTVDPDGNPLAGVVTCARGPSLCLTGLEPSKTSTHEVLHLAPGEPRTITFWHKERRLVARLTIGDDPSALITLKLQPWGRVTGRVVDHNGKRGRRISVLGLDHPDFKDGIVLASNGRTTFPIDEEGRFQVEGLIPGTKYELREEGNVSAPRLLTKDLTVAPGETRDLGDLTSKESPR